MALQGEAVGKVAVTEQMNGLGFGDFINVADDEHVSLERFSRGGLHGGKEAMEEGVAEKVLVIPGAGGLDGVVDDNVDQLGVEGAETMPIVLEMEGFGTGGEGGGGFDDDKVVDDGGEGVQTDFQPIEFGGEEEEIVDAAGMRGRSGGKAMSATEMGMLLGAEGEGEIGGEEVREQVMGIGWVTEVQDEKKKRKEREKEEKQTEETRGHVVYIAFILSCRPGR